MATAITDAFVYEFEKNVRDLGQQMNSRLAKAVRMKRAPASKFHFNRLLNVDMSAKAGRNVATPISGVTHSVRVAAPTTFVWGEALDANDAAQILIDPRSDYTRTAGMAYGRKMDAITLAAAIGSAATGVGGGGAAAALPGGQKIGGNVALSLDLLRQAKRKMDEAEVAGDRYIAVNAKGLQDLLAVTEVTSGDYNTVKALVNGELNTFLGFGFIRTELMVADGGTGRKSMVCFTSEALGLCLPQDGFTRVAEDPANSFMLRVYLEATLGAVRIEDAGVVAIEIAN